MNAFNMFFKHFSVDRGFAATQSPLYTQILTEKMYACWWKLSFETSGNTLLYKTKQYKHLTLLNTVYNIKWSRKILVYEEHVKLDSEAFRQSL